MKGALNKSVWKMHVHSKYYNLLTLLPISNLMIRRYYTVHINYNVLPKTVYRNDKVYYKSLSGAINVKRKYPWNTFQSLCSVAYVYFMQTKKAEKSSGCVELSLARLSWGVVSRAAVGARPQGELQSFFNSLRDTCSHHTPWQNKQDLWWLEHGQLLGEKNNK